MLDKIKNTPWEKTEAVVFNYLREVSRTKLTKHVYEACINPIWRPVYVCIEASVRRNISEQVKEYEF